MASSENRTLDLALIVHKDKVQQLRQLLKSSNLWNGYARPKPLEDNKVAVPVKSEILEIIQNNPDEYADLLHALEATHYTIDQVPLCPSKKETLQTPAAILREAVKQLYVEVYGEGSWRAEIEKTVPTKWERHGDLVVLPQLAFQDENWQKLGTALWECVGEALHATRVAQQDVNLGNDFRSPGLRLLLGDDGWVEHVDNGIRYTFDVTRCMFSAGNVTEKLRVAAMDCQDQVVVDMYAGIGYFSLPFLVHGNAAFLHACEWNPAAVEALNRNLHLNWVEHKASIYPGDNREVCPVAMADRVNLGLIPCSCPGWRTACLALNPHTGGTLHIHHNVESRKPTPCGTGTDSDVTDIGPADNNEAQKNLPTGNLDLSQDCDTRGTTDAPVDSLPSLTVSRQQSSPAILCDPANSQHSISSSDAGPAKAASIEILEPNSDVTQQLPNVAQDSNVCYLVQEKDMYIRDCSSGHQGLLNQDLFSQCDQDWQTWRQEWIQWCVFAAKIIEDLMLNIHGHSWRLRALHLERVKSYAPHIDHMVLDLKCSPHLEAESSEMDREQYL